MPALTIGSVNVKAVTFARLPDERGGGGMRRTLNGDLRGRSDWTRRAWTADLYVADGTELGTLLNAFDPDEDVNVSGDAIGSTVSARVAITGEIVYTPDRAGWYYAVPITIREV